MKIYQNHSRCRIYGILLTQLLLALSLLLPIKTDGAWSEIVSYRTGNFQWINNIWTYDAGGGWQYVYGADVWIYVLEPTAEPEPAPSGFVWVEGGTLAMSMGTRTVSSFYMGVTEVTWGEWQTVKAWGEANGYEWKGPDGSSLGDYPSGCADDHPVHSVNWYDVLKWSNAKSEMEGLTPVYTMSGNVYRTGEFGPYNSYMVERNLSANGYRLPLEAEWEFAARGGNLTNGYTYAGSNDLNAVGWYWDNASGAACNLWLGRGTWPVGQKAANELGLYDMSGNVWEWCWDPNDSGRHRRGGGWHGDAFLCAVSFGDFIVSLPDRRSYLNGFRLARSSGS